MKMNSIRAVFSLFILAFLTASAYPQWVQTNWPEGNSFFNLYANQGIVFARIWDSNSAGRVFFSDNQGKTWAQISSTDSDIDILSIVMWDNKILAGTWEGLYGTMLADISWIPIIPVGIPQDAALCSISMIGDTFYAGSIGKIYKSNKDDFFNNWADVSNGIPENIRITSIVEYGDAIYAGSDKNGIFMTQDGGENWIPINTGLTNLNIFQLTVVDTKLYAVTLKAGVFALDSKTQNWVANNSSLKKINCLLDVDGSLFAGTDSNGVYLSEDSGQTWIEVNTGLPDNTRIWSMVLSNDNIFAGTSEGIWKINPEDINNYTITASAQEGGTISPEGNVTVYEYCSQTVTISAAQGYRISNVIVDGNSLGVISSYTFSNVTENHNIIAEFAVAPHTITASAGEGGTISPLGTFAVSTDTDHTFTITPLDGYEIYDVVIDGVSAGAVTSHTFSSVNSDHTIVVMFRSLNIYQINCGGEASSPYAADQYFTGGTTSSVPSDIITTGITNPAPQDVYRTERIGNTTYTFPNLKIGESYKVRLHFSENMLGIKDYRKFDVTINGTQVLASYNIYTEAGAKFIAVVKEFSTNADSAGQIVIEFKTVRYNATIGGIEIIEE